MCCGFVGYYVPFRYNCSILFQNPSFHKSNCTDVWHLERCTYWLRYVLQNKFNREICPKTQPLGEFDKHEGERTKFYDIIGMSDI